MIGALTYHTLWLLLRFFRLFWWRWEISGSEHIPPRGQGMIIAANHLSWTDVHVLGASMPRSHRLSWIAKAELFAGPLVAWGLRQMLVIPIRRGQRDLAALAAAEQALERGAVLTIFPEGHRSRTGGLLEGRGGAIRLAARTGCPIVPVAVWGTEAGMRGALTRRPIHVRVGQPYFIDAKDRAIPWDQMDALTDDMMLRIAALLPEQYWGAYRERMEARVAGQQSGARSQESEVRG